MALCFFPYGLPGTCRECMYHSPYGRDRRSDERYIHDIYCHTKVRVTIADKGICRRYAPQGGRVWEHVYSDFYTCGEYKRIQRVQPPIRIHPEHCEEGDEIIGINPEFKVKITRKGMDTVTYNENVTVTWAQFEVLVNEKAPDGLD